MVNAEERRICDIAFPNVLSVAFDDIDLNHKPGIPTFFMLSGTPGSGKTLLRDTLFDIRELTKSTILVNTDDLRPQHPAYQNYLKENAITAPAKANNVAIELSNRLQDEASKQRLNIFLDTTFGGNYEGYRAMLQKYKQEGYRIEMHSLVVSPNVSLLGNYLRYLNGFETNTEERLVSNHNLINNAKTIPDNVERLSKDTGLCDDFFLYTRHVYRDESGQPQNKKITTVDCRDWKTENMGEHIMTIRNRVFTEAEAELYQARYQSAVNMMNRHDDKILPIVKKEFYPALEGLRQMIAQGLNK